MKNVSAEDITDVTERFIPMFTEERKNGEEIKLIKQVSKKILKGMSAEEIAETFEEPLDDVKEIYDIAVKYAPGYDADEIYRELVQSRNNAEAGK